MNFENQRFADLFNPATQIRCVKCGEPAVEPDWLFGCSSCDDCAPLEVNFDPSFAPEPGRMKLTDAISFTRKAGQLLAPDRLLPLGRFLTPLVEAPLLGTDLHLKLEFVSPTASHKDRYHALTASIAQQAGFAGIVTSSTGNHGVAAAAFGAAAGLPVVVFCHHAAPIGLLRTISALGGIAVQLPDAEAKALLIEFVQEGWFPATSLDPIAAGASNPFGAEAYKAIALEIVLALGRTPAAVIVPTAGGDTVYGVAKGFFELSRFTGQPLPKIVAVQPETANPLSRSIVAGESVTVEGANSIALSLSDTVTGRQAMVGLSRTSGVALDVTDDEIKRAVTDLAAIGIYVEPSSAAALAGYRAACDHQLIGASETAVLLLTASGFKWPAGMAEIFATTPAKSRAEIRQQLEFREEHSKVTVRS
jgi:threonine synthase